jgi:hypothetical protein
MNDVTTMSNTPNKQTQWDRLRARRDKSRKSMDIIGARHIPNLTPNDRLLLAQRLIVDVLEEGVTYADFQSAQAVKTYATKARNALRGLSLS